MRAFPVDSDDVNVLEDGSLSGTPRVIEILDNDGTPYYLKVYPSYGGSDKESPPETIKSYTDTGVYGTPVVVGFDKAGYRYLAKAYPSTIGLSGATDDGANDVLGIQADQRIWGDTYVVGILSGGFRYYFKMVRLATEWTLSALPVHICNRCGALWIEDDQMYDEVDRCPHCGVRARPPIWEGKEDPMVGGWV